MFWLQWAPRKHQSRNLLQQLQVAKLAHSVQLVHPDMLVASTMTANKTSNFFIVLSPREGTTARWATASLEGICFVGGI